VNSQHSAATNLSYSTNGKLGLVDGWGSKNELWSIGEKVSGKGSERGVRG